MLQKALPERAYVIGIHTKRITKYDSFDSMTETKRLITTAGAQLIGDEFVDLRQYSPSTFLGQGKVVELKERFLELKPDIVVIDHPLSPVQNRNLEEAWCTRVIDRTGLILDIFAQRARSKEGKLQVELAQYEYLLPRLVGAWTHLSKQKGGIGLRGPGETQLEVDRRRVRERITFIKKNLKRVSSTRENHRERRHAVPLPTVSLVGYTNAGKSTLFNALTGACEVAEDKLFATLDPITRKLRLPSGQKILLTDTVGFIRHLPHQLVESFRSTFQEVAASDLLVHVIDACHPDRAAQIEVVESLIAELGLSDKPMVRVMNKIDQLEIDLSQGSCLDLGSGTVKISGLEGLGLDRLLETIEDKISDCYYRRQLLLIPHGDGRAINDLYNHGSVIDFKNVDEGSLVEVDLPPKWQNKFKDYVIENYESSEIA